MPGLDAKTIGIDPSKGGAVMIVSGTVLGVSQPPPRDGEQPIVLVEIGWFGGNAYFTAEPGSALATVAEGEPILLRAGMAKRKSGWSFQGKPQLVGGS